MGDAQGSEIYGPGRRFVPGVAAGICRRPDDRPKAETHPPNASMNVCLVNSGKDAGVLALDLFVPCAESLDAPVEPAGLYRRRFSLPLLPVSPARAANSTRWRTKMEALEGPDLYHPERREQRDEDRLVDQVDKERVPPERDQGPRDLRRLSRDAGRPLGAPVQDVAGEET